MEPRKTSQRIIRRPLRYYLAEFEAETSQPAATAASSSTIAKGSVKVGFFDFIS